MGRTQSAPETRGLIPHREKLGPGSAVESIKTTLCSLRFHRSSLVTEGSGWVKRKDFGDKKRTREKICVKQTVEALMGSVRDLPGVRTVEGI